MARTCYLLFFFLAIQGSMVMGFYGNCDEDKCKDLELKRELDSIDWMPTTEEQLNRFCPRLLKFLTCALESLVECSGKDLAELVASDNKTVAATATGMAAIGDLVNDICTPGSEIRENYLSGISCFKDLVMDPGPTLKCYSEGYAMYGTYVQSKTLLGNPVEDKETESWCIVIAYTLACFTAELQDTCGEAARKTFLATLKRFQSPELNECSEANIRSLKTEFLDFLKLEEERRSIFSSVFEMKKRRK